MAEDNEPYTQTKKHAGHDMAVSRKHESKTILIDLEPQDKSKRRYSQSSYSLGSRLDANARGGCSSSRDDSVDKLRHRQCEAVGTSAALKGGRGFRCIILSCVR